MSSNSFKNYLDENRDTILKAVIICFCLIVAAVLVIVLVFHGVGSKPEENEVTEPAAAAADSASGEIVFEQDASQADVEVQEVIPTITTEYSTVLYKVKTGTMVYALTVDDYGNNYFYEWSAASQGEYYCAENTDVTDGYVAIKFRDEVGYLKQDAVEKCENAIVLPTQPESQLEGDIYGQSACGPTAACILVNNEKKLSWDKDVLIQVSEAMGYNDQGNLQSLEGGMTGPRVVKLINEYSGGELIAENVFDPDSLNKLKELINGGHRVITSVRYLESQGIVESDKFKTEQGKVDTSTHFVVMCGYYENNGQCTFFFADPYYNYGGDALSSVDSKLLEKSISNVNTEPQTMIILK